MKLTTKIDKAITYTPQDDFYKFVNREWLETHTLPDSESRWGTFDLLRDKTAKQLHAICEEASQDTNAPIGSNTQIIRDFYALGMDTKKRDAEGITPIEDLLKQIDQITSVDEIVLNLAAMHKIGFSPFFSAGGDKDVKDPDKASLYISQAGLGLPDRDYYLDQSSEMQKIRQEYLKFMTRIFKLSGILPKAAQIISKTVFDLESKIAKVSVPREILREIDKNYHKYSVAKAEKEFIIFAKGYLKAIGGEHLKDLIIQQPEFLAAVEKSIDGDLDAVKLYLKWNVLNGSASFLSTDFGDAKFDFYGKVLQGLKEQKPLWKRIIQVMQGSYGTPLTEALGPLYIEKYFSPDAKTILYQMIDDVKECFKARVKNLDWMDQKTKQLVYKKVDKITFKLGFPDQWEDISSIGVDQSSFIQNYFKVQSFEFSKKIKEAGGKANWDEWVMNATVVNACADQMREMTFPAAFFQDVFFDVNADMATNYGSAGSVMGHELSHFVDDQGCKYDVDGRLNDWWPKEVKKSYAKGAKAFVDHYNKFSVDGVPVNGEFTQGENIGDVAGLLIAYDALQKYIKKTGDNKIINGLTPEQRFFIGFAKTECGHIRLERRKESAKIDPHAPGEVRVNASLSIIPEFVKAFNIKLGDRMYISPKTFPKLW